MRGFTLVETLIYIALFSLIFSGALLAVYELLAGSQKNTQKVIIEEEANFLLRKIEWALTGADEILEPVEGENGRALLIDRADEKVGFVLVGDNLAISRDAGSPVPLNNERVGVSVLTFEHLPATGEKPAAVRTSFVISDP